MFSIYENNKKISGACRSFVLCLDCVGLSPFICFNAVVCKFRFAVEPWKAIKEISSECWDILESSDNIIKMLKFFTPI